MRICNTILAAWRNRYGFSSAFSLRVSNFAVSFLGKVFRSPTVTYQSKGKHVVGLEPGEDFKQKYDALFAETTRREMKKTLKIKFN